MKKKTSPLTVVLSLCLLGNLHCTEGSGDSQPDPSSDTDPNTDSDSHTDSDTASDTDSDSHTDSDTASDTDSDSHTDSDTASDTDSDSHTDSDTASDTDSDSHTDSDTASDTDSDSHTDSDTASDTDSDSHTDSDTASDTDSDSHTDSDTASDTDSDTGSDTIPSSDCQVYVKESGDDNSDGSSWENAKASVNKGIAAAKAIVTATNEHETCQVWVAKGTYYPTLETNRNVSIELEEHVYLYGGFDGTETSLQDRDFNTNVTILSGNIGDPDIDTDNSFTVLVGADNSLIDGFTITKGYASGDTANQRQGGGMRSYNVDPVIRNCIFVDNTSQWVGGAIYLDDTYSAVISNCTFLSNWADVSGGAIYLDGSSRLTISNSTFFRNTVTDLRGGAICATNYTDIIISNCEFTENATGDDGEGGAIYSHGDLLDITNTSFTGNVAGGSIHAGGGAIYAYLNTTTINGCSFSNNQTNSTGGALDLLTRLSVYNSTFFNNHASEGGAINNVSHTSIHGSAFISNSAYRGGAVYAQTIEIVEASFENNYAGDYGGAIFGNPDHLENALFIGNHSQNRGGAIYLEDRIKATCYNCTFNSNASKTGAAIYAQSNSELHIRNSIVYKNYPDEIHPIDNVLAFYSNIRGIELGNLGLIDENPKFINTPLETTTASYVTETTAWLDNATTLPTVGDIIEIGDDDVARTVTEFDGAECTFSPALADAAASGRRVDIWGPGVTNLQTDLHLQPGSPCIDGGDGLTAPESDLDGLPRFDDPDTTNTGMGTPVYTDHGCYEFQGDRS